MRRPLVIVMLGTLISAALAVAINVATGGKQGSAGPGSPWWAWPMVAVLVAATAVVTWLDHRSSRQGPSVAAVATPAELPGDIADFTGRDEVVRTLRRLIESAGRSPALVIAAITGMAGIGKTALAVRVAHHVRARFPDGQFYVNLRGAEAQALDPLSVLNTFLTQLGMISLPDDLDGRTRAYRSRVAGRRILVVLDNAADESQVMPLLPGSSSCAVIVTSRSRLNLPGASPVMLDVLPADEAVKLLARVAGPERVTADRDHAAEIVRLCGRLPIAIRIAGAVLARRPQQSLTRFAEQLTSERPLDVLSAGVRDDLRVSFSLSYRNLGADEQRQFRLLALLRTPDFPAWCGDALTGTTGRIGRLVDAQLLEDGRGQEDIAGQTRYRCHDLLRAFAREQVEATETSEERLTALERLLSRYLVLSRTAGLRLQPVESWDETVVFRNGSLAWFIAEHTSLVAAVEQAAEAGLSMLAWQLTLSCEPFFERQAQWDSWQHTCDVALAAATAAGDRRGEAHVLRGLGYMARERGDFRRSLGLLERSRSLFRELDDRFGEARVLCNLIRAHRDLGRFADAQECYRLALPVARDSESRWLEANVERNMGMAHRDHGDATEALKFLEGALPLFRAAGDELLETYTLRDIGMVQRQLGRKETSMACFREALAEFERLGDQRGGARALNSLGVAYAEQHRWSDATTCFARSLALFREIGDRRWEAYTLRSLGELHCQLALEARQPGGTPLRRRAGQRALWHDAEASLLESRRILDELADRPWEAQTLLSLGDCYLHQNLRDKAIECLTRCLAVFMEIGNHKGQIAARELLDRARPDQNSVM